MSGPYREPQPPAESAESAETVPDFGNRPLRKPLELAQAFLVSALLGVGIWLDHHDIGLALLLSAPVFLVVAAIVLLQVPVREWRARHRARVNVAAVSALEAEVADEAAPQRPHVRIGADVSAEPRPPASHDEVEEEDEVPAEAEAEAEAEEDREDQPARRSRSTRGS